MSDKCVVTKTKIVQGDTKDLSLYVVINNDRPKDLTGFDEMTFRIRKEDSELRACRK